jgi:cellulose synthase/poly-beta-1,6-N-acetylglucosamine synthase-like glycosyltransferase
MLLFGLLSFLALVAIWGGYPLAVRVLGALRRERGEEPSGATPSVSVIIASLDEAAAIDARIDDVLRSLYPPERIEVIVALDSMRAKATAEKLGRADPRVSILVGDLPGGKASSLNAAARAAKHDLLVFTDTAQRFEPDAIGELVAQFRDPGIGAASGMLELGRSGRLLNLAERYWLYERWLRRWEARLSSTVGVTGAIYAMRRSLWEDLPAALILDDLYGPMRLVLQGWRVGFTERALAHDARRFAASDEYRRKVRTLTGVIQVCAWLPQVLNPIRNPIWLQFVFHKLLRLVTPYLTIFVGIAAVWIGGSTLLASRDGLQILAGLAMLIGALSLIPRVRRVVRAQVAWGVALQSSIIVATLNGIRGRWNVWQ